MTYSADNDARAEAMELIRASIRQDLAETCRKNDELQAKRRAEEERLRKQKEHEEKVAEQKRKREEEARKMKQAQEDKKRRLTTGTLESRLKAFGEIYPNATLRDSPVEAINAYVGIAKDVIASLLSSNGDKSHYAMELVYTRYTSVFYKMKDITILRGAACVRLREWPCNEYMARDIMRQMNSWNTLGDPATNAIILSNCADKQMQKDIINTWGNLLGNCEGYLRYTFGS